MLLVMPKVTYCVGRVIHSSIKIIEYTDHHQMTSRLTEASLGEWMDYQMSAY